MKVVMIVSKILSVISFGTTNLWTKKPVENSQNSQILDETPGIAIYGWDNLPDEIIKRILIQAIKSSYQACKTYNNITK